MPALGEHGAKPAVNVARNNEALKVTLSSRERLLADLTATLANLNLDVLDATDLSLHMKSLDKADQKVVDQKISPRSH